MFGISAHMRTHNLSRLGVVGTGILCAAQVSSVSTQSFVLLAALRCAAGLGLGILGATANTAATRTVSPERAFGVSTGIMVLLFSALSLLLPWAGQQLGPKGMFLTLAVVSVICLPTWLVLPAAPPALLEIRGPKARVGPPLGMAVGVISTMLLFSAGAAATFAFSERIGHSIGMTAGEVGTANAVAYLLSIFGSLGVMWLGTRMGRTFPLLIGLFGTALSCAALGEARNPLSYAVALIFNTGIWWFAYSYIMGIASVSDKEGRLASVAGGTYLVGFAFGTAIAGKVATNAAYSTIGWVAFSSCAAAAFAILHTARTSDRSTVGTD